MKRVSSAGRGVAALVLSSVLWGTSGTAASFVGDAVSPLAIGASTFVVGGLLLFAFSARASVAVLRDATARRWLILGAGGVVAYALAFYSAMDVAGVAIGNAVALGSGPLFAAGLEWVVERRPLSIRWAVCAGIAVVGVLLLSTGRMSTEGADVLLGVALGLCAGFSYALYSYASSRVLALGHSGRGVMGGLFALGAAGLIPVLLVTGAPLLHSVNSVAVSAYLALGPMFAAYLAFGVGLRSIRASVATTITLIEPLVAAVLAVTVVGERLLPSGWLGFGLVVVGVGLLLSARLPGKPSPAA